MQNKNTQQEPDAFSMHAGAAGVNDDKKRPLTEVLDVLNVAMISPDNLFSCLDAPQDSAL